MTGNEYPEWLVGKVADLVEKFDSDPNRAPGLRQMSAFGIAEQILDALGFERRTVKGVLIGNGRYVSYSGFERPDAKWYSKWEAGTEWKEVTDG